MKKSFMKNCRTFDEVVSRAAELLVYECLAEYGYRHLNGRASEDYWSLEWRGFAHAFGTLFSTSMEEGKCEFYAKVHEIEAKVKEVGAENYPWSWRKDAPFSDEIMALVGMKLMGQEILSVSEDPERSGMVVLDLGDNEFPLRLHITDVEKLAKDGTLVLSQWCGGGHKLIYYLQHADGSNAFEKYPEL